MHMAAYVLICAWCQNFSLFSKLELQQDYYNKNQVAIFIVLVVRHRREGEQALPEEVLRS